MSNFPPIIPAIAFDLFDDLPFSLINYKTGREKIHFTIKGRRFDKSNFTALIGFRYFPDVLFRRVLFQEDHAQIFRLFEVHEILSQPLAKSAIVARVKVKDICTGIIPLRSNHNIGIGKIGNGNLTDCNTQEKPTCQCQEITHNQYCFS